MGQKIQMIYCIACNLYTALICPTESNIELLPSFTAANTKYQTRCKNV